MTEQIEATRAEIRELERQKAEVIENSTAERLKRLNLKIRNLHSELQLQERGLRQSKAATEPSQREIELTEKLKHSVRDEASLSAAHSTTGLATKYVCDYAQGLGKHKAEIEQIETALRDLEQKAAKIRETPHTSPGRRLLGDIDDLRARLVELKKESPHIELGFKIFQMRQERAAMTAERDQLRAERESQVA